MATATTLLDSHDLYFGGLNCPAEDAAWGEENFVTRPIVAFPSTPVWLVRGRSVPRLVTRNDVTFHHAGSEYRRVRFRGAGYRCLFVFPSPSLVREVASEFDPAVYESATFSFPAGNAPLDPLTFRLTRQVAGDLGQGEADMHSGREALYRILRRAVRAAYRWQGSSRLETSRPGTIRARTEVLEGAKEELTVGVGTGISLDSLARTLHTSPYHLARLFRDGTGYSVHGYLTQLRLRTALESLSGGVGVEVGRLASELGFSSHSHFTAAFRRAFGSAPSRFRRPGMAGAPS